ncbi:hypothetical protein MAR_015273 [Mya arenaria]|uniref:Uncharacterized protein n=1 Tax=Mya arenaria TaxID=6604 RepID=A0ABY7FIZ6_MYAAR|nr:hypothetical protein MAR_015273 [Mya arenaria]
MSTENQDSKSDSEIVDKMDELKKPTKSFSINSILARVEKARSHDKREDGGDRATGSDREAAEEEDVPAVISKLEFPYLPGLPRGFPELPRPGDHATGSGGLLQLGHLPAWYHWYASQQTLQQWQQQHKKSSR